MEVKQISSTHCALSNCHSNIFFVWKTNPSKYAYVVFGDWAVCVPLLTGIFFTVAEWNLPWILSLQQWNCLWLVWVLSLRIHPCSVLYLKQTLWQPSPNRKNKHCSLLWTYTVDTFMTSSSSESHMSTSNGALFKLQKNSLLSVMSCRWK